MAFRKGFYKGWITDKALLELRSDIVLNSLFISDYENRFGIEPEEVCNFFNGYIEYLEELAEEDNFDFEGDNWEVFIVTYDTDTNLRGWYGCHDENPFTTFVN